jgi:hypothetical protein
MSSSFRLFLQGCFIFIISLFLIFYNVLLLEAILIQKSKHSHYIVDEKNQPQLIEDSSQEYPTLASTDNDSMMYVLYTLALSQSEDWRMHHSTFDGPPEGRNVYWSSLLSWLTLVQSKIYHLATGVSLEDSIISQSVWTTTYLMVIFTGLLTFLVLPWFSFGASFVFIFSFSALCCGAFRYGTLDHTGLVMYFPFLSVLLLIMGYLKLGEEVLNKEIPTRGSTFSTKTYFILSGIFLALGSWIQATVILPTLALIIGWGLLDTLFFIFKKKDTEGRKYLEQISNLWKTWAITGCTFSLLFYFLDYFPDYLHDIRLEINHPFLILSWFCAVLFISQLSSVFLKPTRLSKILCFCFITGSLVYPLMILLGPESWYSLKNSYLQHTFSFVGELAPLDVLENGFLFYLSRFGLLHLFVILDFAFLFFLKRHLTVYQKSISLLLLFLTVASFILMSLHSRFVYIHISLALCSWFFFLFIFSSELKLLSRKQSWLLLIVLFVGNSMIFFMDPRIDFYKQNKDRFKINSLIKVRDISLEIAQVIPPETRVISTIDVGWNIWFGKLIPLNSLYWENIPGLKAETDFFCATSGKEALEILRRNQIKAVILDARLSVSAQYLYLKYGSLSQEQVDELYKKTLIGRLIEGHPPSWLKQIPAEKIPLSSASSFKVFEVVQ